MNITWVMGEAWKRELQPTFFRNRPESGETTRENRSRDSESPWYRPLLNLRAFAKASKRGGTPPYLI